MRTRAATILSATPALEGVKIEVARGTELQSSDFPAVSIYAAQENATQQNMAGTAPLFLTTVTVHIVLDNAQIRLTDAIEEQDALIDAVKCALMTSPLFMRPPVRSVTKIDVSTKMDGNSADSHQGKAVVSIEAELTEAFEPHITDDLLTIMTTFAAHRVTAAAAADTPAPAFVATTKLPPL